MQVAATEQTVPVSVYETIGGDTIKVAVTVFYHRVFADELLAPYFAGIDAERLVAHQRAFLTTALGGPDLFAGRSTREAHRGLRITDEAFDAVCEHLAAALLDVGIGREHVAEVMARVEPQRADIVADVPADADAI